MSNVDLESVRHHVELLKFCKAKIAELKDIEKNSRAAIEAVMQPDTVGLLDGEPAVNWSSYKTSRFDQSAFAEDHPDLLEQYKAMKEVLRFEII